MISFYLKYAGGNIFINAIASCVSETIGTFAVGIVQRYLGTKHSFFVCFGMAFLISFPLLFLHYEIATAICVFGAKFFVEAAFMLAYYVNSEIFPPLFVPFSFSVCIFCAKAFTIAAPQIAEIKPRQIPVIIFLVMSGVATLAALILRKRKE